MDEELQKKMFDEIKNRTQIKLYEISSLLTSICSFRLIYFYKNKLSDKSNKIQTIISSLDKSDRNLVFVFQ
jgi:transcription initiation factor IIE alpha subunit